MKRKLKICLIFGGKSGEHEVSLQSAKSVYEALDKGKYDVLLVGVDKKGLWHLGAPSGYLLNAENPKLIKLNRSAPPITAVTQLDQAKLIDLGSGRKLSGVDVFFPLIHGTYGEDGSLQGFLELLGAAYTGAGVLGSALGMDKDVMKRLLRAGGIPTAEFVTIKSCDLSDMRLKTEAEKLKFPVFVKPANLGSSVGVSKARDFDELKKAVEKAFLYDEKVLLEKFVRGREIECSVLGNEKPIASLPGEVIPKHDFYSYEAKYIDEKGADLKIPADLPKDTIVRIQELAVKAFKTLECAGMARVDFFLKPDGTILLNEINTIPGFTKISMYPKLWEVSGIPYSKLLDIIIKLAIGRKNKKDRLTRTYGT